MNTTEIIAQLNRDLVNCRLEKTTATESHNLQLTNGIQLIKEQFDSIAEVKSLSDRRFINGINKKLKAKIDNDFKMSDDLKRILKIGHKLICNYKAKKELLTIAQIEQLFYFEKALVNNLMKFDDDLYVHEVKKLLNKGKKETVTKVFSVKKAKEYNGE